MRWRRRGAEDWRSRRTGAEDAGGLEEPEDWSCAVDWNRGRRERWKCCRKRRNRSRGCRRRAIGDQRRLGRSRTRLGGSAAEEERNGRRRRRKEEEARVLGFNSTRRRKSAENAPEDRRNTNRRLSGAVPALRTVATLFRRLVELNPSTQASSFFLLLLLPFLSSSAAEPPSLVRLLPNLLWSPIALLRHPRLLFRRLRQHFQCSRRPLLQSTAQLQSSGSSSPPASSAPVLRLLQSLAPRLRQRIPAPAPLLRQRVPAPAPRLLGSASGRPAPRLLRSSASLLHGTAASSASLLW